MRKTMMAAVALLMAACGTVRAQEAATNWQGFYLGLHAGGSWGRGDTTSVGLPLTQPLNLKQTATPVSLAGFLAGPEAGYNFSINQALVVGIEADYSLTTTQGTGGTSPVPLTNGVSVPGFISNTQNMEWLSTVRARLGFPVFGRFLAYGTGGLAIGHVHYTNTVRFPLLQYADDSERTKVGWTAGAGIEWAVSGPMSLKLEYLYYDLGTERFVAAPSIQNPPFMAQYDAQSNGSIVRAGFNYRF